MGKRVSNALPRIFTAISFCFVAIAAPLINSINAFAALPEGLVANDDDDFAEVGELDTTEETTISEGWKLNSSNLYSGRMERGDIRIHDLNLSTAIVKEYALSGTSNYLPQTESSNVGTLVTNENERVFRLATRDNRTALIHDRASASGVTDSDDHYVRLIFENAAEIIQTGEILDFHLVVGDYLTMDPYIIVEDSPETNYTALLIGSGQLDGESTHSQPAYNSFAFQVHRHGASTTYGAQLNSFVAIYDLDMPFCPAPGYVYWDRPHAEVAQPYWGITDDKRFFIIKNAKITATQNMVGPGEMDITSCTTLHSDTIVHNLQSGFVLEANFGSYPGFLVNSYGTFGAQKVIDFNLTFPIVEMLAGEGGSLSATDPVVERNFGDPYVLQVTPDEGYNIKNIIVGSLDSGRTIKNFTLEDFLADSATVPGSVVTLDNGIQFKYKGDGVVNVILPPQYMLGQNDVAQPNYDDYTITVAFEDENGNSKDPAVPNTSDAGKVENPNTADAVYLPVIILSLAIVVLAYRKRRQI